MKKGGEKEAIIAEINNEPPTDEEEYVETSEVESIASAQYAKEEKMRVRPTVTIPTVACLMGIMPSSAARDLLQSQISVLVGWYYPNTGEAITKQIMNTFENPALRNFLLEPDSLQQVVDNYYQTPQNHLTKRKATKERSIKNLTQNYIHNSRML